MKNHIPYLSRIIVGALFIAAALSKAMIFPEVAREIIHYKLVPESFALPGAWALLVAEFTVGIFLLTGYRMKYTTWAANALLVLFLLVKISAVVRGIEPCSTCFGTLWVLPLWGIFTLNGMMIGLLLLIRNYETRKLYVRQQA